MMFAVVLELSFITIFGIFFAFLYLLSGAEQRKEEEKGPTAHYKLFSLPSSMPGHHQTGTSLYFQSTNTCFPVGIEERQLGGFFEDEDLGV